MAGQEGNHMKKKGLVFGIIAVILTVAAFVYFRPMPLSDLAEEDQTVLVTYTEFSVKDGVPLIDTENYNDITDEQKSDILRLMGEYSYTRTFGTAFSDGSLDGLGTVMGCIYIYEGNDLEHSVVISDANNISVDNKTYKMKNSLEFLDRLSEIVGGADK